jgi:hypothetical protein
MLMSTVSPHVYAKAFVPAFVVGGLQGTVVASVVNATLFLTTATFAFPPDAIIPWAGAPVNLEAVIVSTVIGGALAVGGNALLRHFLPQHARAKQLYRLAAVVLLLMAYWPFMIRNVGTAQIVVMQLMHVVAGLVPLYGMARSEQHV